MSGDVRIGTGLDVHAFSVEPRPLILAGVRIPDSPGLAGHSDADVVTHAVTDALLGALARGDLGTRFGVDRPEVAGADSLEMLRSVIEEYTDEGWQVGNVDVVVVAQRPRLGHQRDAMRERLAASLSVGVDRVSVKATTTDGLDAIGRGEGIAAWATAILVR